MNIAIFDSGIGGLSVLYQAKRMLPEAHFLYYADEDHVPYGEKTREQILTYTDEAVRFLLEQGADAIVLACNTATSVAAATLRDRYPLPIIGMEPAVKLALNQDDTHRVLVILSGGEVLVRPDLDRIGLELYRREYPWGMVTNGLALDEKRFDRLLRAGGHHLQVIAAGKNPRLASDDDDGAILLGAVEGGIERSDHVRRDGIDLTIAQGEGGDAVFELIADQVAHGANPSAGGWKWR